MSNFGIIQRIFFKWILGDVPEGNFGGFFPERILGKVSEGSLDLWFLIEIAGKISQAFCGWFFERIPREASERIDSIISEENREMFSRRILGGISG